jgi:hypothetical protein
MLHHRNYDLRVAPERSVDFTVSHHGSIAILTAVSAAAQAWRREHLPEDALTWGRNDVVIEPRYLSAILDGIVGDGLEVA